MPMARLNGVALNYRSAGEGSDVMLIHGLAANHAFWRLDALLPLARRHRVTVFDLRGHGYSSAARSGYTTADMAGDLCALLDQLDIAQAHLVGHSYGGVVGLQSLRLTSSATATVGSWGCTARRSIRGASRA
jgi:pimeloyl-ACP methyl ester carboxylesterase